MVSKISIREISRISNPVRQKMAFNFYFFLTVPPVPVRPDATVATLSGQLASEKGRSNIIKAIAKTRSARSTIADLFPREYLCIPFPRHPYRGMDFDRRKNPNHRHCLRAHRMHSQMQPSMRDLGTLTLSKKLPPQWITTIPTSTRECGNASRYRSETFSGHTNAGWPKVHWAIRQIGMAR